jgi:histidine ammonia-lyase
VAEPLHIDGTGLTVSDVAQVARAGRRVGLDPAARGRMAESLAWVESVAAGELRGPDGRAMAVYGVNTGFGSLARVRIPADRIAELSRNLVRSHAAGVGSAAPRDVSRAMVLLRANALARGVSGCRPELVELLCALLERGIDPVVPSQGSCGSSGDLAPLAHLALLVSHDDADPAPETGEAWVDDRRVSGREALAHAGLRPVVLGPKEGLALTNGAQLTTAFAALAVHDACELVVLAEVAAAMSIEALRGVRRAFHPLVHVQRPYPGARACAANLLALMAGSELADSLPDKVQDAYSLRCTPPVLGAVRDALAHARTQIEVELNSATDNPLIVLEVDGADKALSAGLFHGEPVGLASDYLKLAVAELASLAERRLYRLLTANLSANLPASMRGDSPGLGLLTLQTTAAALVSENKALGWPASMDSIPTCEDQEDHVAMSTTAARRAAEVVENSSTVIAIELLCAARALRYRREVDPQVALGRGSAAAFAVLDALPDADVPSEAVQAVQAVINDGSLMGAVRVACPDLAGVGGRS